MKSKFLIGLKAVAVVIFAGTAAFAQNEENRALIEVVNDPIPAQAVQSEVKATQTQVQAAPSVVVQPTSQPVLLQQPQIVQQQPTIYVQKQAATVVEDTPLTESAADKLRRQRIEMEQQTESKIVEKLEEARMKAEQERAQKLLTGLEAKEEKKEEKTEQKEEAPVVAPVIATPEPVQVVAPVQQVQVFEPVQAQEEPAIQVKSELAALDEDKKSNERMYVTFDFGFMSYGAKNVDTGVGLGANLGMVFNDRYVVEGNFMYTRADIESVTDLALVTPGAVYPTIIQMDQYNFGGTFKYRILTSRFSPYIGGSLAYVYRDYKDQQSFGNYGNSYYPYSNQSLDASSWALDVGLLVGADIKLSENVAIGTEFKYMMNVVYDIDSKGGLQQSKLLYPNFYADPMEELGYYTLAVSLKYLF